MFWLEEGRYDVTEHVCSHMKLSRYHCCLFSV